ncbi:MAG: FkbM family methyltransferase [Planctomycetota bacterium]|jgi:FkbM family methyltransferase
MRSIELLCERIRSGDVFYDVGAHVGLFSCCVGAVRRGDVTVHAFEPMSVNAQRLTENAELNGLSNIHVHEVAFSDERGQMKCYTEGGVGTATSSLLAHHWPKGRDRQEVTVEVYPPVQYSSKHGLPPPTLVKCDVEGAEGAVLRGMQSWLEDGSIRLLLVEYHLGTLSQLGESREALESYILGFGYRQIARLERRSRARSANEAVYERNE